MTSLTATAIVNATSRHFTKSRLIGGRDELVCAFTRCSRPDTNAHATTRLRSVCFEKHYYYSYPHPLPPPSISTTTSRCTSSVSIFARENTKEGRRSRGTSLLSSAAAVAAATSMILSSTKYEGAASTDTTSLGETVVSVVRKAGGGGGGAGGGGDGRWRQANFAFATAEHMEYNYDHREENTDYHMASSNHNNYKNYDVSVQALQGRRESMEDEYKLSDDGRFAAVFDGHGGGAVSAYLKRRLYEEICNHLEQKHWEESEHVDFLHGGRKSIPSLAAHSAAIRGAINQIDDEILQHENLQYVGSTAVAVVLHESEDGLRTILSANIGDSRAILCRKGKAVELTRDHKPNDEKEKNRILNMGETIEWDKSSKCHRVRNLAVSRAVGDKHAKPTVTSEVEIKHFPLNEENDEFIVLASDGLWDVMTNQEVVNFVDLYLKHDEKIEKPISESRKTMAGKLAREAYKRGSSDNICVVLVWLKDAAGNTINANKQQILQ